ncbi:MAG: HAD-IC family P-type ATPase [Armatimonadetes bacterium]|nr:HAD-IC family P-type ATPase [Armatimonadota bacterium]
MTLEELPGRREIITLRAEDVPRRFKVGPAGLDEEEARARLTRFGPNVVAEVPAYPVWRLLVDQIASPLIYVLIAAAVVTTLLHHYSDTAVIVAVLLINGTVGFVQEYRATRAIEALGKLAAPVAHVRRSGRLQTIPSAELVPGDLLILEAGSQVGADARVIRSVGLRADESLLTGESVPVDKTADSLSNPDTPLGDIVNMVFAGTLIVEGRGEAVVCATGPQTELGMIAGAMTAVERVETPLQERLRRLASLITVFLLGCSAVVVAVGLYLGEALVEVFLASVAMAVSAIPEGLPIVVTIVLSVGAKRMAERNMLIRKLPAAETMGGVEVICTDKTGTLTTNRMTLRTIVWGPWEIELTDEAAIACPEERLATIGDEPLGECEVEATLAEVLQVGVLCNNAECRRDAAETGIVCLGDPTETAIVQAAIVLAPRLIDLRRDARTVSEVPFDSARKFMATVHELPDGRRLLLAKGSPEVLLPRCTMQMGPDGVEPLAEEKWLDIAEGLANRGQRVLALCQAETDKSAISEEDVRGLVFMGLIGLLDPPRPEAAAAVQGCKEAGVRVVMVTGDHPATARAIAIEVGILSEDHLALPIEDDPAIMTGTRLQAASDQEIDQNLERVQVYARVTPRDKLRIVEAFQRAGKVVAVTGDGVNDAPALRRAHIGLAMGRAGTDSARQASDAVLLDDSFASIYDAIGVGRLIFENIRKVVFFLMSSGVAGVLSVIVSLLLGWKIPYTAAQLLWVNLVTNGFQDIALAFEPAEAFLLKRRPYGLRGKIFDALVIQHGIVVAAVFGAGCLFTYRVAWLQNHDLEHARTVAMTTLVLLQMLHVFSCRSLITSIFVYPLRTNPWLLLGSSAALVAQFFALYGLPRGNVFATTYLSLQDWALILPVAVAGVLAMEVSKLAARKLRRGVA